MNWYLAVHTRLFCVPVDTIEAKMPDGIDFAKEQPRYSPRLFKLGLGRPLDSSRLSENPD